MSEVFILNAYEGTRYTLMRYEGREAVPVAPIVGAHNDGGVVNVAWPSAFRFSDGAVRVYASRYYNNQWRDIAYWHAPAGSTTFSFGGIALAANGAEPYGICPAHIYYDATDTANPWKMVYLVRGASGPGNRIDLADSADGLTWTRRGQVFTASQPFEAAGVAPTWVTQQTDGSWAMVYEAYQTLNFTPGAVAVAATSSGPFINQRVIFPPNSTAHTISGGAPRTNTATVTGQVRLGEPHLLRNATSGAIQLVLPTRQEGTTLYFDDPLFDDFSANSELAHIARNKVSPSYIRQAPDGSWTGAFTGYGQWPGVLTEYVFLGAAPTLDGPWEITQAPLPFPPWTAAGRLSTENPAPLIDLPFPLNPPPSGDYAFDPMACSASSMLSNANRTLSNVASGFHGARTTPALSGKVYLEVTVGVLNLIIGAATASTSLDSYVGSSAASLGWQINSGSKVWKNGAWAVYSGAGEGVPGDTIMLAVDKPAGKMWGGRNGVWHNSGDPATGANPMPYTLPAGTLYLQACSNVTGPVATLKQTASYTPPAGFTFLAA